MAAVDADPDRAEELVRAVLDGVIAMLDAGIADCEQWLTWADPDAADVAEALVMLRDMRGRATELR